MPAYWLSSAVAPGADQAGHLEFSTVALVSSILREAIALVLIPLAVKFLLALYSFCAGGEGTGKIRLQS